LSADTFTLTGNGIPPGAPVLLVQGTARATTGGENGVVFGDGLRCVSGTVTRLGVTNVGQYGYFQWPPFGAQVDISVLGMVAPGDLRHYQGWYRDVNPAFCTSATFNLTNGVSIVWQP
jgi:hypothetical protein